MLKTKKKKKKKKSNKGSKHKNIKKLNKRRLKTEPTVLEIDLPDSLLNAPPFKNLVGRPKVSEDDSVHKSWPKWGNDFLKAYHKYQTQHLAAAAIEVHPTTVRKYKRGCKEFREAVECMYNTHTDELERAALSRATYGTDELYLHEGQPIYISDPITGNKSFLTRKKYETSLTIFMLKGRRREIYYPENQNLGGTADDKAAAVRDAIAEIAKVMAPEPLE